MTKLTQNKIISHLLRYIDPLLAQPLLSPSNIKNCVLEADRLYVKIELGFPCEDLRLQWQADLHAYLQELGDLALIEVGINEKIRSHQAQQHLPALTKVKNIICVASGKGGVGKSTTAVNLALALKHMGARVGLLDCDIYGPNQPQMLGVHHGPELTPEKKFKPVLAHGLQTMSIGYLVDEKTAMVWRGPMISKALEQLTFDTLWDDLDYLVLDMPPGTGDIALTLAKKIPTVGALLVTTPQSVATHDVQKGIQMFNKVGVAILGVVENMAVHICPDCGARDLVFGEGGGERMAQEFAVPFVGRLPLNRQICLDVEAGLPTVARDPQDRLALDYLALARRVAMEVAKRPINHAINMPRVVVEA